MEIYGYRRSYVNTILTWTAIVASAFLLRLVLYWRPHWVLYLTFSRCPLEEAEKVLLIDKYNQFFVEKIQYLHGVPSASSLINKGHYHQPDEDEILSSVDDAKYGKKTYGSLIAHSNSTSGSSNNNNGLAVTVQFIEPDYPLKTSASNIADGGDVNNNSSHERIRFFENKKIRYIWDEEDKNFVRLRGFDRNVTIKKLQTMTTAGLSKLAQWQRRQLFGENAIHIEVQPYFKILFEEVLGPFYIFQLFSIVVWFNEDYYYYGTCIIIMSIVSLVSGVVQIRRNQQQLRDTVESVDYVKVCRGKDHYEEIESSKLVPGDIVVVPTFDSIIQFDGILINGNVIVNESMLTGESVPVTKTPLQLQNFSSKHGQQDVYYDEKEHAKHTLFCGTKVMQTRYYGGVYVKALVIRVGFQTAKGELIRSIMFPKPVDFRFNKQIHKFVGVLACVALLGFTYSVVLKTKRGAELKQILISALDLITIVVPPALPAAMTIGIIYAQSRLRNNKIYCISPRSINISGCINCVCFDKTGTLTDDNLSFNEVAPLIEAKCCFGRPFDEDVMQTDSKKVEKDHHLLLDNGDYSPLMICLASCHSLTIIDQKIIGDPLDLQMFEATGWVLEEPDVDDENKFDLLAPTVVRPPRRKRRTPAEAEVYAASGEFPSSASSTEDDELDVVNVNTNRRCQKDVGILRQFPFSSNLQRMSVVTRQFSGDQYVVYCKGAPEKIASLCDPATLPDDFSEVLHAYTRKGFRVLAMSYRPLKAGLSYTRMQRASRQDIEKDLRFLGFLTLGNLLKPETIPVIETLNKASIRCVMVTGDNMLTAISVANECRMISDSDKVILLQVEKSRHETLDESIRPQLVWHRVNNEQTESLPAVTSSSTGCSLTASGYIRLKMPAFVDARTHLALTGETWDVLLKHYPEMLNPICMRGTVFARMSPQQKQQLVEQLQTLDYYVGMCGDGANDSGALRSAHAGISLSDTEASIAAPFTSANANISCVPILIGEGRAALVTAFGILKYMALYSMTQFCSVLLLYTLYSNLTDGEFLYEDLVIIATLVALFGRTEPYPTLDSKAPSSSLLSVAQLSSVGIQLALVIFFQVISLVILWQNPWYVAHDESYDKDLASHDNFAIFAISSFQCIALAMIFSKGKPYRKSVLSNHLLTGAFTVITTMTVVVLILAQWDGIPIGFRLMMILLALVYFIVAMIGEKYIVDHLIFRKIGKLLK